MKGFTLIELMVTATIMMLTAGVVIAGFTNYSDSQRVKQEALTLKNNLRLAAATAASGKKPPVGCSQLIGYEVQFPTATTYRVQARCTEGLVGNQTVVNLGNGINFAVLPPPILYPVLGYGALLDAPVIITFQGRGKTYGIQLAPSGEISELGFN